MVSRLKIKILNIDNSIMAGKSKSELFRETKKLANKWGGVDEVAKIKRQWVGSSTQFWRISAAHYNSLLSSNVKSKQSKLHGFFRAKFSEEKKEREEKENIIIIRDDGDIIHSKLNELPLMATKFSPSFKNFTPQELVSMRNNPNLEIGNLRILDSIDENEVFNILVKVRWNFEYDGKPQDKDRFHTFTLSGVGTLDLENSNLTSLSSNRILEKNTFLMGGNFSMQVLQITLLSVLDSTDEFKLVNTKLRHSVNLVIPNVNTDIKYKNIGKTENCVREWLRSKWRKMGKKTINNLGDESGVTITELGTLCKKYGIKYVAYDINGKVLMEYSRKNRNKTHGALYFQAYNGHIYPLTGPLRLKKNADFDKIEVVKDALKKLEYFVNMGFLPMNVKASTSIDENSVIVLSFTHNRVKYIENPEYYKCLDYLKMFGLEEKIYDSISVKKLADVIETLYNHIEEGEDKKYFKTKSFWPNHSKFVKGGYNHSIFEQLADAKTDEIVTIDKNKCYANCLATLPYLIHLDYRQSTITKINKEYDGSYELKDKYLYIVQPEFSSILIPDLNVYTGATLKYAHKEGVRFEVLESMTTKKSNNYFTKMIMDIYKKIKNKDDAKSMVNICIGKMEQDSAIENILIVDNIYNNDEVSNTGGYSIPLNDEYSFNIVEDTKFNTYCRKPISIQIKDASRIMLYEKMKSLNLKSSDIIQVKTDSFSFYKGDRDVKVAPNQGFLGWKSESFKPLGKTRKFLGKIMSFYPEEDEVGRYNVLHNCYAGVGKTYDNIHVVIPKLQEQEKSFLIITPSHATANDYRSEGFKCQVSQYYGYDPTAVPEEDVLIFDEIGLLDRKGNNFIYRMFLLGKTILARGDFKQLLPVGEKAHFNSPQFLYLIFGKNIKEMNKNMRNDFTIDYYDKLINEEVDLIDEIEKHSVDWKDAEKVICYRNKTVDFYNSAKLEIIGKEDMIYEGSELRCITNSLNKYNVYNNFYLTIKRVSGDDITFDSGLTLPREKVMKCFKYGFAITLYGAQGKSFKSFHYPERDYWFIVDDRRSYPRRAYTLISRIKTKFY